MRTASEFDAFYGTPDPWRINRASARDKALSAAIEPYVADKSVLELGCGEGHLTATIFRNARTVKGIDISGVAIARAQALGLANASFEASDFLNASFAGHDVITAIECLYYLLPKEQDAFFRKLADEHRGKTFILSAPIIGRSEHRTYFTDGGLKATFAANGMSLVASRNLNAYWNAGITGRLVSALASRLPLAHRLMPLLPERLVYQRCYVVKV